MFFKKVINVLVLFPKPCYRELADRLKKEEKPFTFYFADAPLDEHGNDTTGKFNLQDYINRCCKLVENFGIMDKMS